MKELVQLQKFWRSKQSDDMGAPPLPASSWSSGPSASMKFARRFGAAGPGAGPANGAKTSTTAPGAAAFFNRNYGGAQNAVAPPAPAPAPAAPPPEPALENKSWTSPDAGRFLPKQGGMFDGKPSQPAPRQFIRPPAAPQIKAPSPMLTRGMGKGLLAGVGTIAAGGLLNSIRNFLNRTGASSAPGKVSGALSGQPPAQQ